MRIPFGGSDFSVKSLPHIYYPFKFTMPKKVAKKAAKKATKKMTTLDEEPCWSSRSKPRETNDYSFLTEKNPKDIFEVNEKSKAKDAVPIRIADQGLAVGDQDMPEIGLAYPSLCWEMFTEVSVLPASSCFLLGGPTSSFKSHLVVEFGP